MRHRRCRIATATLVAASAWAVTARSASAAGLQAQRSEGDELVSEREPLVRFEIERDVFLPDETPQIVLEWLGAAPEPPSARPGARPATPPVPISFSVSGPGGPLRRRCPTKQHLQVVPRSSTSTQYFAVGPDCYRFTRPGRYRLVATPRALSGQDQRAPNARQSATVYIRVVERPPATPPSNEGVALSLQVVSDAWKGCAAQADDFRVVRHRDDVQIEAAGREPGIPLPSALRTVLPLLKIGTGLRKRPPVASALQSTARGWLVGTRTGEPGGRLLAVESPGATALAFETGYGLASSRRYCAGVTECRVPQDVAAIEKEGVGDSFVVFQGHDESGRISKLSWQDGRWSARVLTDLHRAPGAWVRRPSSSWLVVTGGGLVEVAADGTKTVLAHLPTATLYPSSMVELASGTIWIGVRGGAIRLTPVWKDAPAYWPELVVRTTSRLAQLPTPPCP